MKKDWHISGGTKPRVEPRIGTEPGIELWSIQMIVRKKRDNVGT
jgi:hypothetical protein